MEHTKCSEVGEEAEGSARGPEAAIQEVRQEDSTTGFLGWRASSCPLLSNSLRQEKVWMIQRQRYCGDREQVPKGTASEWRRKTETRYVWL